MNSIRINSEDQFSGATMSKEIEVDDKALESIEAAMLAGAVFRTFSKKDQINYDWVIVEVERL
jgi:hypothetical protein